MTVQGEISATVTQVVLAEQQFQEEREVKSLPSSSGIHQVNMQAIPLT